MKNVIKLSCTFFVLGLLFIQIIPTTKPVTQEQKQEETIEVAEETVEPSVADVEVKPTTEDVKVEDKQEVVKQEVVKPKKEEKKVEVVKEVEQVEVSEVTELEKAQEVVSSTMTQYEGNYSVAIEDIGIMVLLNVEEFTEAEQFNALDVDQAINKALRVNGCEVPTATVVVDINTNEVYFTIANGQILN